MFILKIQNALRQITNLYLLCYDMGFPPALVK